MPKNNKNIIHKAWIDESGDAGLKTAKGSSRFFIVTMIYFSDEIDLVKIEKTINQLRKKFKINQNFEFKFSRSSNRLRSQFLQTVGNLPLCFKAIVIDKFKFGQKFKNAKTLTKEVFKQLLSDAIPPLNNAQIIIDRNVDKLHQQLFNSLIKKELPAQIIKTFKHKRSKGDILIQIADMIAGSIFHKFEKSNSQFFKIIARIGKIIISK